MRFLPIPMKIDWFDFYTLRLLNPIEVEGSLAFLAVALLCEVDWKAFGTHNRIPHQFESSDFSHIRGSAPVVPQLPDKGWKRGEGVDGTCLKFYKASVSLGMSM